MEMISKDITFQDYVSILKAYFKKEDKYVKSLIVNGLQRGEITEPSFRS
jgi:hypothetical protein